MSGETERVVTESTSGLTQTALISSMVRKLRGFNPDSDEDSVLGTILSVEDGGKRFVSSAAMWQGLVLKAVWKRDKVKRQDYADRLLARWPSNWLDMTPQELAEELLP